MPLASIDHVLVAVRDLEAVTADYEKLTGRSVSLTGSHPDYGTANAIFQLENTYVELISPVGEGPFADRLTAFLDARGDGLIGIALGTENAQALSEEWRAAGLHASAPQPGEGHAPDGPDGPNGGVRQWCNVFVPEEDVLGLFLFAIEHVSDASTRPIAAPRGPEAATLHAVDHVVVNTPDGDRAVDVFGTKMGIRLALDRDAPQWGARMMFFRLGGITLEVIQRYGDDKTPPMAEDAPAFFWGMAFRAADVAAACDRLAAAGVTVSEVRKGRKPGTVVATVKDHSGGVPTLIIGPDPEAEANT